MQEIGEGISEQLDIIPAKIQVIQNVRKKYACKACEHQGQGARRVHWAQA
ncbi:IS66 family transposase zinc-finger binding domain-containing protein [Microbulbifer sp. TB1203]